MGAFLASLLGWLAQAFTKEALIEVAKWVAFRAFMVALLLGVAVPVLRLVVNDMMNFTLSYVQHHVTVGGTVYQVSGLAGWFLHTLHFETILAMWLGMIGTKAALRMLPFSPVR